MKFSEIAEIVESIYSILDNNKESIPVDFVLAIERECNHLIMRCMEELHSALYGVIGTPLEQSINTICAPVEDVEKYLEGQLKNFEDKK